MNKQSIRQRYRKTSHGYTFADFCQALKDELGETIFSQLEPKEESPDIFSIIIPEANRTRIAETISRGYFWTTPIYSNQNIAA